MRKPKKPSYRKLLQELEMSRAGRALAQEAHVRVLQQKDAQIKTLQDHKDREMIQVRTNLANALCGLIRSATDAVKFVVAPDRL